MRFLRIILKILAGYLALVVVMGILYTVVPPVSTLMLARWISFSEVTHEHVPLKSINRNLVRALIIAEDDAFCSHWGVNWHSMNKAIQNTAEKAIHNPRKRITHGASTIPMQVAKNMFLWPKKSYLRKMFEVPIAVYLNAIWSKARMMEVYLSIAQWGEGIFGAEAAAKKYFNKPASQLSLEEASLLVAALPNPITRHPNQPSAYLRAYSSTIQKRSVKADLSCL